MIKIASCAAIAALICAPGLAKEKPPIKKIEADYSPAGSRIGMMLQGVKFCPQYHISQKTRKIDGMFSEEVGVDKWQGLVETGKAQFRPLQAATQMYAILSGSVLVVLER